jgi:hypothetical protein
MSTPTDELRDDIAKELHAATEGDLLGGACIGIVERDRGCEWQFVKRGISGAYAWVFLREPFGDGMEAAG